MHATLARDFRLFALRKPTRSFFYSQARALLSTRSLDAQGERGVFVGAHRLMRCRPDRFMSAAPGSMGRESMHLGRFARHARIFVGAGLIAAGA
jgi:hypothetical protein